MFRPHEDCKGVVVAGLGKTWVNLFGIVRDEFQLSTSEADVLSLGLRFA